jgi:hypothetical protein
MRALLVIDGPPRPRAARARAPCLGGRPGVVGALKVARREGDRQSVATRAAGPLGGDARAARARDRGARPRRALALDVGRD